MTKKQVLLPTGSIHETNDSVQKNASRPAGQVDSDSQSVAGEEDPGASLDLPVSAPANSSGGTAPMPASAMNPGDEAPEGTPGTGENICQECGGLGRAGDATCPSCQGSGKVIVAVGGA